MNAPTRTFTVSTAVKACDCGNFAIGDDSGTNFSPILCGQTTKRTFAPGHDARLKGNLIRAAVANLPVRRTVGDNVTVKSALEWADIYGFGYLVRNGVDLHLSKAIARSSKKAAAKAQPAPAVPTPGTVADILSRAATPADLTREDEQAVRDALGTFIQDPAEAEALAYGNSTADLVHIHDVMDEVAEELAAEEVAPPTVAKVGRHQYEGELIDGAFHYNDRKGNPQVAKKFTIV